MDELCDLTATQFSRREIQRAIRAFYMYQMDDGRELKSLKFLESVQLDWP